MPDSKPNGGVEYLIPKEIMFFNAPMFRSSVGDTDYTLKLMAGLNRAGVSCSSYEHTKRETWVKRLVINMLGDRRHDPIIHLQLRPPGTGAWFDNKSIEGKGIGYIVTVHEFSGLTSDQHRIKVLDYIQAADHVIFTTAAERDAVVGYMPNLAERSSIIPVFPTIQCSYPTPEKIDRPNNVLWFGTIRGGKGIPEIIKFAYLIGQDEELKGKTKIIVVGTPLNPVDLSLLLRTAYGLKRADMPAIGHDRDTANNKLAVMLADFKKTGREPISPIEIHLSVNEKDLPQYFDQCNFAYLPITRGANSNSAVLPVVMGNGCVTISKRGLDTPVALESGGVLFAQTPGEALTIIKERIKNPDLNIETRSKANEYVRSIALENAVREHVTIYSSLSLNKELGAKMDVLKS